MRIISTLLLALLLGCSTAAACETVSKPIELARASLASGHDLTGAKIINGDLAKPGDDPWQVAIVLAGHDPEPRVLFCGGSLIAARLVLTAAHCVDNGTPEGALNVLTGTLNVAAGGERIGVKKIYVHPSHGSPKEDSNDVAILLLASDAQMPAHKVALIESGDDPLLVQGLEVRVTGWGAVVPGAGPTRDLRTLKISVISNANCNDDTVYGGKVDATMLCAGAFKSHDACQGDSGGPLTALINGSRTLVGVVSWGEDCGVDGKWGVYARVSGIPWAASCVSSISNCTTAKGPSQ